VRLERVQCEWLEGKASRLTFGLNEYDPRIPAWSDVWAGWHVWKIHRSVCEDLVDALEVIEDYHRD
jgi:hypothetical protein